MSLDVVLPGDHVTDKLKKKQKLGPGLRRSKDDRIIATLAGRLEVTDSVAFVRQSLRRYRPMAEDRVVGIVESRMGAVDGQGDVYRLNIGASHLGNLNNLAFEGATKRNRPRFSPGDLVYARVASVNADEGSCTLSCTLGPHDVGVPRKDWMTNESAYGELRGGTTCQISTGLSRELLHLESVILQALAMTKWPFEVAVGVNGIVWMHSSTPEHTVAIRNALMNAEVLAPSEIEKMVKDLTAVANAQARKRLEAIEES